MHAIEFRPFTRFTEVGVMVNQAFIGVITPLVYIGEMKNENQVRGLKGQLLFPTP